MDVIGVIILPMKIAIGIAPFLSVAATHMGEDFLG
jgi:hypothetical protein